MRWDRPLADARCMDTSLDRSDRTLVVSALLSALGPLVGNGLYAGPTDDSPQAVVDELAAGLPAIAHVALTLELVGFAAMAVFFAGLVVRTFRAAPVAALTAGIAGATMLAVKVGSAGPMMLVHRDASSLDPALAVALLALNDMAFIVSGFLFCLAMCAAGVALSRAAAPRALSGSATVLGAVGVVAGIAGILRPDAYVPIPFLLLLLWLIALAVTIAMGRGAPVPDRGAAVTAQ